MFLSFSYIFENIDNHSMYYNFDLINRFLIAIAYLMCNFILSRHCSKYIRFFFQIQFRMIYNSKNFLFILNLNFCSRKSINLISLQEVPRFSLYHKKFISIFNSHYNTEIKCCREITLLDQSFI